MNETVLKIVFLAPFGLFFGYAIFDGNWIGIYLTGGTFLLFVTLAFVHPFRRGRRGR